MVKSLFLFFTSVLTLSATLINGGGPCTTTFLSGSSATLNCGGISAPPDRLPSSGLLFHRRRELHPNAAHEHTGTGNLVTHSAQRRLLCLEAASPAGEFVSQLTSGFRWSST